MAKKIKLTRPELKRLRDQLRRFERYLPMLKLKQQQLQLTIRKVREEADEVSDRLDDSRRRFAPYHAVLRDRAGVNIEALSTPSNVLTHRSNIAGVWVPVFDEAEFPSPQYSLFVTPAWVDQALLNMREISRGEAELNILREQERLLDRELTKIVQRVNLFEKVKIPENREAIRRIRIHLGDEMTAAVGRAKIAKGKITEDERNVAHQDKKKHTAHPAAQEQPA